MDRTLDLLKQLTHASGVSGFEREAGKLVAEEFAKLGVEPLLDKMGSVIGLKRAGRGASSNSAPSNRIMLAAHLDEIGLMVTKVDKGGYLRFTEVGGFDVRTLLAQEIVVHGKRPLKGVIGAKPPHLESPDEAAKIVNMEDLFIDIGLAEEEVKREVHVGDVVMISRQATELKNKMLCAKALDNRASVVALILVLELLQRIHHTWDVYAVATAQEEESMLGAMVTTYAIRPDIGLAIDVTMGDSLGVSEAETFILGKGPAIAVGPNIHPKIAERLMTIAKNEEIPYQLEPSPGVTGTDAAYMQISREGIPTGLISIPLRYLHTSVETVLATDIERSARLIALFISGLDGWRL